MSKGFENISAKSLIVLIGAFFFLGSCDEKDCIYVNKRRCDPNYQAPSGAQVIQYNPDLSGYEKKILLEDFTGMKCQNCLPATQQGEQLVEDYYPNVVLVGVHCTSFFAEPDNSIEEYFNLEMRTIAGTQLESDYNIISLPTGAIDRAEYGTSTIKFSFSAWEETVQERFSQQQNPPFYIEFSNLMLTEDSSSINLDVIIKPLIEMGETQYNYTLALIQNSIHEAQKNADSVITDYEHNHVLRENLNGSYGQPLIVDPSLNLTENEALSFPVEISLHENGEVVNNAYGQPLLLGDWNVSDIQLIAYVNKNEGVDDDINREIMQVESIKLEP